MNVCNDTDNFVSLQALGWKPLETERKKCKAKIVYNLLNKMAPNSLTNLFTCNGEMTNCEL